MSKHKKKRAGKKQPASRQPSVPQPNAPQPRPRIWELDAFRGLCILGMVIVHFIYDLTDLYRVVDWKCPAWFAALQYWGGVVFLLISGICVTLGCHHVRRGLILIGCGFLCTAVTFGMFYLNLAGKAIIIWFGVLHCLGCCMILWHFFRKLSTPLMALCSALLIGVGFWLRGQIFTFPWLMPLGFLYKGFASSDYFPLIMNLGFFLVGALLGRTLYKHKRTLFPRTKAKSRGVRFLITCGRHSLWIYLLHQPVLSGICLLLKLAVG